jgi:hypothetical protein
MKSKLVRSALQVLMALMILIIAVSILKNPHESFYTSDREFIFSQGDAPDHVRSEVVQQLKKFQAGYVARDASRATEFTDQLFSKANTLVLGTMPKEIFVGHSEAQNLIYSDWESWGDCRFLVDSARVSSYGDVAWISTIGYVEFDLSRFLIMPLRLSGVLVKEDGTWRFRQLQFQFDLDLSLLLLLIMVLIVLLTVSLAVFLFRVVSGVIQLKRA